MNSFFEFFGVVFGIVFLSFLLLALFFVPFELAYAWGMYSSAALLLGDKAAVKMLASFSRAEYFAVVFFFIFCLVSLCRIYRRPALLFTLMFQKQKSG